MSFSEWKEESLGNIASYSSDKVNIQEINVHNYVSTENLLPNIGGLDIASSLPTGNKVTKYQKGDILISNIRPYFKKIWLANTNGGCSNDVLVLKVNDNVDNSYLYYNLANDKFFDYVMSGAKGTKMPRGDKQHILKYKMFLPSLEEQKALAYILSTLDEKIEVNNQISKTLEEMAQTLFKHWFVDFEFPNENGEPYKSSGGEMVESELGLIPKGWEVNTLSDIATMKNGVNYGREQDGNQVRVINVRDFDGSLTVNGSKLDSILLPEKKINEYLLQKYDTVVVRSAKPGETLVVIDKKNIVYSGFTIRVRANIEPYKLYVFYSIRNAMKMLNNSSNGTVFKNLNQQILGSLKINIPAINIMNSYNLLIKSLLDLIHEKINEKDQLVKLRDTLLSKLMSGEIRLPHNQEVDVS